MDGPFWLTNGQRGAAAFSSRRHGKPRVDDRVLSGIAFANSEQAMGVPDRHPSGRRPCCHGHLPTLVNDFLTRAKPGQDHSEQDDDESQHERGDCIMSDTVSLLDDPEFALLSAATARPATARHRTIIADIGRDPALVEWNHFIELVERHRVAALVFEGLEPIHGVMDFDVREILRSSAIRDRASALILVSSLHTVVNELASTGIDVVPLKGPVLSQIAFGDPTLRQSKDIDVLIKSSDVISALNVLQNAGFEIVDPSNLLSEDFHIWRKFRKDIVLRHVSTGTEVELHWRLANSHSLSRIGILHTRQTVRIGSLVATTLGADDIISYLCLHGAGHSWFRLKWLADVYALIGEDEELILRFYERARSLRQTVAAGSMLVMLSEIYGVSLPATIVNQALRSLRVRCTVRIIRDALKQKRSPENVRFGTTKMGFGSLLQSASVTGSVEILSYMLIDWPTVVRYGGTRSAYARALFGRPLFWLLRKMR